MQLRLIVIRACLCAFSIGFVAASSLQQSLNLHIIGSSASNEPLKPVILKFDLTKDDVLVRTCYGAHLKTSQTNITYYWILPAECLDKTKYDMIAVGYGYKHNSRARFYLKDLQYEINPSYDAATKANNIALVGFPYTLYMEVECGYKNVQLPSEMETLKYKTLEMYEYKDNTTKNGDDPKAKILFKVQVESINSIWCKILYPLSPIKNSHICLSGLFGKGLSQENLGIPLIARDGGNLKLVGLATIIRSWTHVVSFPIEVLGIQSYLEWIKGFSGEQ